MEVRYEVLGLWGAFPAEAGTLTVVKYDLTHRPVFALACTEEDLTATRICSDTEDDSRGYREGNY